MSLRDALAAASDFDPRRYTALSVEGQPVGWVAGPLAEQLRRWPEVFAFADGLVALTPATPHARSGALADVARKLAAENRVRGWRGERYAILSPVSGEPLFSLERAAMRAFGLTGRAAHLNGYVREAEGWRMWVAERSAGKQIDPGMLDNVVAGGIAEGMDAAGTLVKECDEEAGIPAAVAARACAVGALRVTRAVADGLHDEILYAYDLELPDGFEPSNRDGEVAGFHLVKPGRLVELLAAGRFAVDAGLVAIDFLARNGGLRGQRELEDLLAPRRVSG